MSSDVRLQPVFDIRPGGPVELYRGEAVLEAGDTELAGDAHVRFDWHGGLRASVSGESSSLAWRFEDDDPLRLRISDSRSVEVSSLWSTSRFPAGAWEVEGRVLPVIHGDTAVPLASVLVHVANFPRSSFGSDGVPKFRTVSSDDEWQLVLDVIDEYEPVAREARLSRGGAATHVGQIRRTDGRSFTWEDAAHPREAARFLLSFIAGHRVAPMFAVGFDAAGSPQVEEWADYRRDALGGILGWCTDLLRSTAVESLWPPTLELWKQPRNRRMLTVALEFYLDAQKGRNLETRLVSAQAGLELLAWEYLTEREPRLEATLVDGKGAAWRLRRLLERIEVGASVPGDLVAITDLWPDADGPEAIRRLRNVIVHPKDLELLLGGVADVKHDILRLALWYLELAVLYFLDYRGNHLNRTRPLPIFEGGGEPVPWARGRGDPS